MPRERLERELGHGGELGVQVPSESLEFALEEEREEADAGEGEGGGRERERERERERKGGREKAEREEKIRRGSRSCDLDNLVSSLASIVRQRQSKANGLAKGEGLQVDQDGLVDDVVKVDRALSNEQVRKLSRNTAQCLAIKKFPSILTHQLAARSALLLHGLALVHGQEGLASILVLILGELKHLLCFDFDYFWLRLVKTIVWMRSALRSPLYPPLQLRSRGSGVDFEVRGWWMGN